MLKLGSKEFFRYTSGNMGYCQTCKTFTTEFVEHDAEYYQCDTCDETTVFGINSAIMMKFITVIGDK